MESCQYAAIGGDNNDGTNKCKWIFFLRQIFIASCVWTHFFTNGLWLGSPTVLIPQLRKEANSTAAVSDEMESWLSSAHCYAALPWAVIFPLCTQRWGRKWPFLFSSTCNLISFIIYYYSGSPLEILFGEIIQGIMFASNMSGSILAITEYTSPQYRGVFLTMKSSSANIAIWTANAIGTFFHWRMISIFGFVCSIYPFFAILWPESPYWLASKGKFEECAINHRWLKGTDKEAKEELQNLIESQKDEQHKRNSERRSPCEWSSVKSFFLSISSKQFYQPTLLSILLMTLYHFSGKLVCAVYATQIIKKVSQNESTAYTGMLILDGFTIFGMYFGCVISKFLNRRTLLLTASLSGALFLYILSLYLYLVNISVIQENNIVSLFLLTAFSFSISCGPLIMATSIYGELIPQKHKRLSVTLTVLFTVTLQSILLKVAPSLFRICGMHGTFLFFGVSFSVCICLFYKFIPETKDRTLQEIEVCLKENS